MRFVWPIGNTGSQATLANHLQNSKSFVPIFNIPSIKSFKPSSYTAY